MILPSAYSSIRHLSAAEDIRSNLRLRYEKDPDEENSKELVLLIFFTLLFMFLPNLRFLILKELKNTAVVHFPECNKKKIIFQYVSYIEHGLKT